MKALSSIYGRYKTISMRNKVLLEYEPLDIIYLVVILYDDNTEFFSATKSK